MRFPLGRVVATPGALRALEKAELLPAEFLDRHVNGDWGDVQRTTSRKMSFPSSTASAFSPRIPPAPGIGFGS
jgi:hypothetical protein